MTHTNSATSSTILSTLPTKSDYHGTIGIALTIHTSLAEEKISLQCLAITYHTKPAPKCMQITICKIRNTKSIPVPALESCINEIYEKFWSRNIQQGITNDGQLHSGFQHQLVVLNHFVWRKSYRVFTFL